MKEYIHRYIYCLRIQFEHTANRRKYLFTHLGGSLLLCGTGYDDQKIGCRLCVHHGDVRSLYGLHPAVDRVHDRATVFAGDRRSHVQHVRNEAVFSRLRTTGGFRSSAGRLLYQ